MSDIPLPERARPEQFDELLGQELIWQPQTALWQLAKSDRFHALIFWGPPGSGKTSLAQMIGKHSERKLISMSAVHAGVKDIRTAIEQSKSLKSGGAKGLIIFMDEIHRLSKSQQDVLLPGLEAGDMKFIGATTENPSFEVNKAVISRSLIFRFERVHEQALIEILYKALRGHLKQQPERVPEAIIKGLARAADGDARRALNLLDSLLAVLPENVNADHSHLDSLVAQNIRAYDKNSDQHYDTISAFIKSVRASDPDAAIYYLARMLDASEDPEFIARRLIILAAEDIGNANPTGLLMAQSAMQAVLQIGMPEARIILAQVTTYLAASPKSNRAYLAINQALEDVRTHGALEVPLFLRNAVTGLMREFGLGKGYCYPHDDPEGAKALCYMPKTLEHRRYYEPSGQGFERQLKDTLEKLRPLKPSLKD